MLDFIAVLSYSIQVVILQFLKYGEKYLNCYIKRLVNVDCATAAYDVINEPPLTCCVYLIWTRLMNRPLE